MNTTHTKTRWTNSTFRIDNSAKSLIDFGRSQGFDFRQLGKAPMPNTVTRIDKWLITPMHLDSTPLPERARQRMKLVAEVGIRPKGWLLIHEAPKHLPAPQQEKTVTQPKETIHPEIKQQAKKALKVTGSILGGFAIATGGLALAIGAITLLVPAFLIAGVVMLDPILVAVTDDGHWIEIDRWDM